MIGLATIIKTACLGQFGNKMEDAVEAALKSHGVRQISARDFKRRGTNAKRYAAEFTYVRRPNGRRSSPNFLVIAGEEITELELHSNRTSRAPTWNAGMLKENRVYVLNLPKVSALRPVVVVPGSKLVEIETVAKNFFKCEEFLRLNQKANELLAISDPSWKLTMQTSFRQRLFDQLYLEENTQNTQNTQIGQLKSAETVKLSDEYIDFVVNSFQVEGPPAQPDNEEFYDLMAEFYGETQEQSDNKEEFYDLLAEFYDSPANEILPGAGL